MLVLSLYVIALIIAVTVSVWTIAAHGLTPVGLLATSAAVVCTWRITRP